VPALGAREGRLERGARRVRRARVLIAPTQAADAVLLVGRDLVDGRDHGPREGVGVLAGVDRARREAGLGPVRKVVGSHGTRLGAHRAGPRADDGASHVSPRRQGLAAPSSPWAATARTRAGTRSRGAAPTARATHLPTRRSPRPWRGRPRRRSRTHARSAGAAPRPQGRRARPPRRGPSGSSRSRATSARAA